MYRHHCRPCKAFELLIGSQQGAVVYYLFSLGLPAAALLTGLILALLLEATGHDSAVQSLVWHRISSCASLSCYRLKSANSSIHPVGRRWRHGGKPAAGGLLVSGSIFDLLFTSSVANLQKARSMLDISSARCLSTSRSMVQPIADSTMATDMMSAATP